MTADFGIVCGIGSFKFGFGLAAAFDVICRMGPFKVGFLVGGLTAFGIIGCMGPLQF